MLTSVPLRRKLRERLPVSYYCQMILLKVHTWLWRQETFVRLRRLLVQIHTQLQIEARERSMGSNCQGACHDCDCGIPEWLASNLEMCDVSTKKSHSWVCGVYQNCPHGRGAWYQLWIHGLISANCVVVFEKKPGRQ